MQQKIWQKPKEIIFSWCFFNNIIIFFSTIVYNASLYLKTKNKSQDILKFAVKRMLPGGPLAKKQLSKLKMYHGDEHPHSTQNPIEIKFSQMNKKNFVKL